MKKSERHKRILAIIEDHDIGTQEELAAELAGIGLNVTQATISRDIASLQLIKEPGEKGSFYKLPRKGKGDAALEGTLGGTLTKIDRVDYLLVLHTLPGGAAAAAFQVDQEKPEGVLGTIAGDDTVLIILKSKEAAEALGERLRKIQR